MKVTLVHDVTCFIYEGTINQKNIDEQPSVKTLA